MVFPSDVWWLIYKKYYSTYVVEELNDTWNINPKSDMQPSIDFRINVIVGFLRIVCRSHEYWEVYSKETKVSNTINLVNLEFDKSWKIHEKVLLHNMLVNEFPTVMRDTLGRVQIVLQNKADTKWNDFVQYWNDQGYVNIQHSVTYKIMHDKAYLEENGRKSHYYIDYASRDSSGVTYDFDLGQEEKIPWFKLIP